MANQVAGANRQRIEIFAQAIVEGKSQSAAYREAFPGSVKWKAKTVHEKASIYARTDKVLARIEALRVEHRKRHEVTVDTLTAELDESRAIARDMKKPEAMTAATMGKAKLHGIGAEKLVHTHNASNELIQALFGNLPKTTGIPSTHEKP